MKVDKTIFYLTVVLLTISVIFVYSLSLYKITHSSYYSEFHFLIRQALAVLIGITLMWFLSTLDPNKYFNIVGMTMFLLFLFLMGAMHFLPPEYVKAVNGAKRWIKLPFGISIAPVEFFKVGFIYFLAWSFSRKIKMAHHISFKDDITRFTPYIALFLVIVYLVAIMQNDFGQVVVMGLILAVMGLMAGISSRVFLSISLVGITLISYLILHNQNRYNRIHEWFIDFQALFLKILPKSFQTPVTYADTKSQVSYSYDAIINGGFFGTGIGNGVIKLGFLPEIHTDFILAGIAEEIGVIGVLTIIFIFLVIVYKILRIANRLTDKVYSNFAFGAGLLIAVSLFINAFGITGVIPIKGIAVPFLSYGGSSIVAVCIMIGMVLMISKKVRF